MKSSWRPYWAWFSFSLRRTVYTRRFAVIAILIMVLIMSMTNFGRMGSREAAELLLLVLTPLLALFYGGGAIRSELQTESLTFVLARPLSRTGIYIGRVSASGIACAGLVLPALLFSTGAFTSVALGYGAAAVACALVYTFIFALFGQWSKRPLWLSIGFLLLWEAPVSRVPGFLGRMTMTTHIRALADLPTRDALLSAYWEAPPSILSVAVLLSIVVCTAFVGARHLTKQPSRTRKGVASSGL